MNSRLVLLLAAASLVAVEASAQRGRTPPRGTRRPPPAEKPEQAPGIPDARLHSRYVVSRFSVEQYPSLSYFRAGDYFSEGVPGNWMMIGAGSHLGFRVAPSLSLTADLTSAALGGPLAMNTAEIGFRFKPWASVRFTPFLDARHAWAYTVGGGDPQLLIPGAFVATAVRGTETMSSGDGTIVALGVETSVVPQVTLSTALGAGQFSMRSREFGNGLRERDYRAETVRLTVGVRYNHGRWIR